MGVWNPHPLGSSISAMAETDDAQDVAIISNQRGTVTPPNPQLGQFWCRTDYPVLGEAVMFRAGGGFTLFADPDYAQINAGGTVAMVGNLDFGGQRGVNVGAPVNPSDLARKADVWPTLTGLIWHSKAADVVLEQAGSEAATFQEVGFVPRKIDLLVCGEVRNQSDSALLGTINVATPLEVTYRRWEGNPGAGYGGTSGATLLASVAMGGTNLLVYVEPKYTAPYGFWLRLLRQDTAAHMNIQVRQALAFNGVGQ